MLPPIFVTLKASAAVKSMVGTNPPRIYSHGEAPQGVQDPYITWFALPSPENTLSEAPKVDRVGVQVDCWHRAAAGVEALAVAVRDAIEPHAHMTATLMDQREPETRLYRISMQYDWWLDR